MVLGTVVFSQKKKIKGQVGNRDGYIGYFVVKFWDEKEKTYGELGIY